ncbi:hypothetical protein HPP92_008183 [Vanilla planifolia]|uniref:Uncharacterized protein n=1 Tax=Vanilla planifolia TaxID=51239 RepID=A0A835R976_VANPL|nr:hypothetical protein HPP92_008183 [Vanilla planifolia]
MTISEGREQVRRYVLLFRDTVKELPRSRALTAHRSSILSLEYKKVRSGDERFSGLKFVGKQLDALGCLCCESLLRIRYFSHGGDQILSSIELTIALQTCDLKPPSSIATRAELKEAGLVTFGPLKLTVSKLAHLEGRRSHAEYRMIIKMETRVIFSPGKEHDPRPPPTTYFCLSPDNDH